MKSILIENKGFVDFTPYNAGSEKCEPLHKFGPCVRSFYLIHFVLSGEGKFQSPRGLFSLKKGDAFIIKPDEVTTYQADRYNPWEYVWIGFKGNLAEKFSTIDDVFEYDDGVVFDLKEAIKSKVGCEELLASVLFKLYASLFSREVHQDYSSVVINYINTHYMENVTISSIASALKLNRKYLSRIFKEKNGVSMQQFLINKRLHEAKKLLKLGYAVEESAYMVGYSDSFGFSKAFKKRYGVSPVNFKPISRKDK